MLLLLYFHYVHFHLRIDIFRYMILVYDLHYFPGYCAAFSI